MCVCVYKTSECEYLMVTSEAVIVIVYCTDFFLNCFCIVIELFRVVFKMIFTICN